MTLQLCWDCSGLVAEITGVCQMQDFLRSNTTRRIDPQPVSSETPLCELVDNAFLSYNAGRLREACQLFVKKVLEPNTLVGVSLSGGQQIE